MTPERDLNDEPKISNPSLRIPGTSASFIPKAF